MSTSEKPSLLQELAGDYAMLLRNRPESRLRRRLLALPRFLLNPSLHAVVLLRLTVHTPLWMASFLRNVLIAKHGMDHWFPEIAPGLLLPHPIGVVIGGKIGRNCILFHNVTMGAAVGQSRTARRDVSGLPVLGDNVVVFPNTVIVGPVTIGSGAVIGANAYVDYDVPPGGIVPGGSANRAALIEGQPAELSPRMPAK